MPRNMRMCNIALQVGIHMVISMEMLVGLQADRQWGLTVATSMAIAN